MYQIKQVVPKIAAVSIHANVSILINPHIVYHLCFSSRNKNLNNVHWYKNK